MNFNEVPPELIRSTFLESEELIRAISQVKDTNPDERREVQYSHVQGNFDIVSWGLDNSVKVSFHRFDDSVSVRHMHAVTPNEVYGTFSLVSLLEIEDLISALQKLVG